MEWNYGQGWSEEQKQLHRIQRLQEEEIKLLQQIVVLLTPKITIGVSATMSDA